jgi:hypothetical protein
MNDERFRSNFIGKITKAKPQKYVDELRIRIDQLKSQNARDAAFAALAANDYEKVEQILAA